ncbi:MAG TPA: hypothetical protein VI893_04510 [Thermoplasmata archaeon]|nr:hypothetical protein [Thermoplasmata archaeon]
MSYSYPGPGRQVSGAAGLARRRREIERKEAVRRALVARRGGEDAPVATYGSPAVRAAPAYAPVGSYPQPATYRAPAPPVAYSQSSSSQAQVHPRKWWEDEPGKKKAGVPKHGKSIVAGSFDCAISLFIFAIAPAVLMSKAAQSYGLDLGPQIINSLLIGSAVAAFAFVRWMFMRGTQQRLLLSIGQVLAVVMWILIAISPNIDKDWLDVKIHIGLLRYLILAAVTYGLTSLYYIAEYFVYKPMYEDMRRAKIAI